jgi:hypothetical protein
MRILLVLVLCLWGLSSDAQGRDTNSGNFFLEQCKEVVKDNITFGAGLCLGTVEALARTCPHFSNAFK